MPTSKPTDPVSAKAAALELLRDEKPALTNPTTTGDQAVPVRTRKTPPHRVGLERVHHDRIPTI